MIGTAGSKAVLLVAMALVQRHAPCAEMPKEHAERIQAALPEKTRVPPRKPRRVLIWNTWAGGAGHPEAARAAEHAITLLGVRTGAFQSVASDDIAMFLPESIKQFDAVVLNNNFYHWIRPTDKAMEKLRAHGPSKEAVERVLRRSLLDYVAGGGGIAAFHFAIGSNEQWPEFHELLGASYVNHPWMGGSDVGIKVDEPDHPLTAAFGGKGFRLKEEIYQFKEPYSRTKLRVLLSLDAKTTNMTPKGPPIVRKDNDFGLAWVRSHGKGRVFYCAFGHTAETFWNPLLLRFFLDGIQFAVGDLQADAAPHP